MKREDYFPPIFPSSVSLNRVSSLLQVESRQGENGLDALSNRPRLAVERVLQPEHFHDVVLLDYKCRPG